MAEFKWIKGNKPKETGNYLITIKENEGIFTVMPDTFFINNGYPEGKWIAYPYEEIVAYAPYPKPYKTRNRNGSKSNNRKTKNKTK